MTSEQDKTRERPKREGGPDEPGPEAEDIEEPVVKDEEPPPPYTMKSIGGLAHRLDRALSERLSGAVVSSGQKASGRLRRGVQSGQWQNYVFLIVVALIVIVVLAVLLRR